LLTLAALLAGPPAMLLASDNYQHQQPVEALNPTEQQELTVLNPEGAQQAVAEVDPSLADQDIGPAPQSTPASRAAITASKVAVGVFSVVVSLTTAAAMLIFL
jgi:hypothetical protein